MSRSMTSYGRSIGSGLSGDWVVEIHSVNKKQLDFFVAISKDLLFLDLEIRKYLAPFFKRGQVTVRVQFSPKVGEGAISSYMPIMKEMKRQIEEVCREIGCNQQEISFPFLYELATKNSSSFLLEEKQIKEDFFPLLKQAADLCVQMKQKEGISLDRDLKQYLLSIQNFLSQIEKNIVGLRERYEQKLLEKLQAFSKEVTTEDRERLVREVFFYIEKTDVSEELSRSYSHIEQFLHVVEQEHSTGKTMDFLLQEMSREINTLCAKVEEVDLTRIALQIRGELEKMKEQVQNIE